ncbi:MAG: T9SS type A sorting domain-containing protein [Bacteroidia bacterium]|nr:T9SS type A sorting domain-containing protein [Bacteroidia bacterium]
MKKTIQILKSLFFILALFITSITYSRPKITYFAKLTLPTACGGGTSWISEQTTNPCLNQYWCKDANGNNHQVTCTSYQLEGFANQNRIDLAKEANCLYENSNLFVACDELVTGRFRAYSKLDTNISVIAHYFQIPVTWNTNGWAYKFYFDNINNRLEIKVFPLVYTNDTLFINNQNENGGYSVNLSISELESDLNSLFKRNLGIEEDKEFFSSDEIKIKIYPNPLNKNSDELKITFQVPIKNLNFRHIVKIFDINGKIIINENFTNTENNISLKNIESGIYIIEIQDSYGSLLKKEKLIIR